MAFGADRNPPDAPAELSQFSRRWRAVLSQSSSGIAGRLASGSFWSFIITATGSALGFTVQYLLSRRLGVADFGRYVVVLGWMNVAAIIVKFELDTVATRFVASYHALSQRQLLAGFLKWGLRRVVTASVLSAGLGAVVLLVVLPRVRPTLLTAALIGCAILPVTSVTFFAQNCLQGIKWIRSAYFPPIVLRPLTLAIAVFVVSKFTPLNASGALALNFGAAFVALSVSLTLLRRGMADKLEHPASFDTREWIHTAAGLVPAAVAQLVLSQASDILVVGSLLGPVEAAKYAVAANVGSLAGYVIGPVAQITAPMVAELHAKGDPKGLRHLMRLVARVNLGVILPASLVIIVGGVWLLRLFGPVYAAAYPVLVILCLGQISATVGGTAAFMLTMTGHQREAARIIGVTAVLNLALALILTPRLGAIGTALSTLTATLTRNSWMIRAAQKRIGVSLMPW